MRTLVENQLFLTGSLHGYFSIIPFGKPATVRTYRPEVGVRAPLHSGKFFQKNGLREIDRRKAASVADVKERSRPRAPEAPLRRRCPRSQGGLRCRRGESGCALARNPHPGRHRGRTPGDSPHAHRPERRRDRLRRLAVIAVRHACLQMREAMTFRDGQTRGPTKAVTAAFEIDPPGGSCANPSRASRPGAQGDRVAPTGGPSEASRIRVTSQWAKRKQWCNGAGQRLCDPGPRQREQHRLCALTHHREGTLP